MRKEVMKRAWKLFNKGFAETFGACLKASWSLSKQKAEKLVDDKKYTVEEIQTIVCKSDARIWRNSKFRAAAANGDGSARFELTNLWVKSGISRLYFDKYINEVIVSSSYIESRI